MPEKSAIPPWQTGEYYQDSVFNSIEFNSGKLAEASFCDCSFEKCLLPQAKLLGCSFECCTFTGCDLNAIKLPDCRFNQCVFENCRLSGIDWTLIDWPLQPLPEIVTFRNCQLSNTSFYGLKLPGIAILDSTAINADFTGADLSNTQLCGTDFERATFSQTDLRKADLRGAISYYIDITNNRITKAHFSHPEVMNLLCGLDIVID